MSLSTLTRNYGKLTADERFALILNAAARGDDAERERLLATAPRRRLSAAHHNPHVAAFTTLSNAMLLNLLDLAAECVEAVILSEYPEDGTGLAKGNRGRATSGGGTVKGKVPPRPTGAKFLDLFRFKAFRMTVEMAGWRLCCGASPPAATSSPARAWPAAACSSGPGTTASTAWTPPTGRCAGTSPARTSIRRRP
jgi:hypothetical protein